MHVFGILHLLMVLLGPSWPLFGQSGPKTIPQMDPKMTQDGEPGARSQAAAANLEALGPKMLLRWLKMARSSPS